MRVAVIGAGPIGLELAVALKRAGIDYVQFDAGNIGSTMQWYPLEMVFHSNAERLAIAGVPIQVPDQQKIKREEFLAYLRAVVLQFDLQIRTYERVESIERLSGAPVRTLAIPDCGHAPHAEHRDRVLGAMAGFIRDVLGADEDVRSG